MYLADLNEAQKTLALDLLIHAAGAEKRTEDAGRARIARACAEMGMDARYVPKLDEDTALRQLTEISSTVTLRKVLVELALLAMPDMNYLALNRAYAGKYAALTGMRVEEYEEMLRTLEEITHACQRLDELVNEPG